MHAARPHLYGTRGGGGWLDHRSVTNKEIASLLKLDFWSASYAT
ncbi:MAG: hypothetical protein ABIS50_01230 [Luteolibacter sp.]